jgi:uncharacterized membrane protein YgaE (UPF0421/DUF939 family)
MDAYYFSDFLRKQYYSQKTRHAIKTSIAAVLSIIIYQYFNLPNGYWAVITAVVIMQSNIESGSYEVTLKLAVQRLVGTATGAVLGFLVIFFFDLNSWELLLSVFILIMLSSFASNMYQGFSATGLTAVIVLLLAHKSPITQNLAFIRVAEIWLGATIAIAVTLLVWPYRIVNYLHDNRDKRIALFHKQVLSLSRLVEDKVPSSKWTHEHQQLLSLISADKKHASLVKSNCAEQEVAVLTAELQYAKALGRLGGSLSKLPEQYWEFSPLNTSTSNILNVHCKMLHAKDSSVEDYNAAFADYVRAFSEFRASLRSENIAPLDVDSTFQMTNVYDALHVCTKNISSLISA